MLCYVLCFVRLQTHHERSTHKQYVTEIYDFTDDAMLLTTTDRLRTAQHITLYLYKCNMIWKILEQIQIGERENLHKRALALQFKIKIKI